MKNDFKKAWALRSKGFKKDMVDDIMSWEDGSMTEADTVKFFQRLIDSGQAWSLQGMYGRQAEALIEAGLCHDSKGHMHHGTFVPGQKSMSKGISYGELSEIQAFIEANAGKGIDEAVRLATVEFPDIEESEIRNTAEWIIPEFPEKSSVKKGFDTKESLVVELASAVENLNNLTGIAAGFGNNPNIRREIQRTQEYIAQIKAEIASWPEKTAKSWGEITDWKAWAVREINLLATNNYGWATTRAEVESYVNRAIQDDLRSFSGDKGRTAGLLAVKNDASAIRSIVNDICEAWEVGKAQKLTKASIEMNPAALKELKTRYDMAVRNGDESFVFDGQIVLTTYAKYLIEYVESKFGKAVANRGFAPTGDDYLRELVDTYYNGNKSVFRESVRRLGMDSITRLIRIARDEYKLDILSGVQAAYDTNKSQSVFKKSWSAEVEKKSDFNSRWVSTDGWRGYTEHTPKPNTNWFEVHSSWVTGDWEDAGDNASHVVEARINQFKSAIRAKGGEVNVKTGQTSNSFSTSFQVFVRGVDQSEAQKISDSIFR